jgi:FtsH-binding integral membrane protein
MTIPTGDKVLSVFGVVLVILAFTLKAIPPTFRLGVGARYYRMDALPFWVLLVAGLVLGLVAILKIILRNNAA